MKMARLREEFQLSSFRLTGVEPESFTTPQARWLGLPYTFVIFRITLAIYQLVFFCLTIAYWGEKPFYTPVDTRLKWFIYISNWTFTAVTIYSIWAAVTATYWALPRRSNKSTEFSNCATSPPTAGTEMDVVDGSEVATNNNIQNGTSAEETPSTPWYFQVQWYFRNAAYSASTIVTILFWALEFDPDTHIVQVFSLHVHGVGLAFMVIDQLLVAAPYRILHLVYVMLTSFLYFAFTGIYYAAGGTNPDGETHIYGDYVDWGSEPGTTAIVATVTILVVSPMIHLIFYALYWLRLALVAWCGCCQHPGKHLEKKNVPASV